MFWIDRLGGLANARINEKGMNVMLRLLTKTDNSYLIELKELISSTLDTIHLLSVDMDIDDVDTAYRSKGDVLTEAKSNLEFYKRLLCISCWKKIIESDGTDIESYKVNFNKLWKSFKLPDIDLDVIIALNNEHKYAKRDTKVLYNEQTYRKSIICFAKDSRGVNIILCSVWEKSVPNQSKLLSGDTDVDVNSKYVQVDDVQVVQYSINESVYRHNEGCLHKVVLTDGRDFSFFAGGTRKWIYKNDTVSFRYNERESGGKVYNTIDKLSIDCVDKNGEHVKRGNRMKGKM